MGQRYKYSILLFTVLCLLAGTLHVSYLKGDIVDLAEPLARLKNFLQTSSSAAKSIPPPPLQASFPWLQCEGGRERKHIAYPKNHKVGGSTLFSILSRYAYTKKLNVIIPRPFLLSRMYPYTLYPEYYMPPPHNQTFEISMHHTVYNRTRFPQIMPKDTAYVTIVRKPLYHLISAWNAYSYGEKFGLSKTKNPIATFLADPKKYDRHCGHGIHVPLCLTQNSISVDLGFLPSDNEKVTLGSDPGRREDIMKTFVRTVDQDFDLVMLTEYYDESLVLLKRLMCWSVRDILYIKAENVRKANVVEIELSPELKQNHKEWSYVDYALYDHFNKALWRRINSSGNDYWGEVRYFKSLNIQIRNHCQVQDPCSLDRKPPLVVNSTRWGPGFVVDSDLCLLLRRDIYCRVDIQAERVGKSLWLTKSNRSVYSRGDTGRKYRYGNILPVVEQHCVYCTRLGQCENLDTLGHFRRDGYISEEVYQMTRKRLCKKQTKRA
ncbi:galactose-3-O-sulfotransferase 2-like [Branchiostoma floridae]|uniref:Galactose-3-O-sulfotransferase 2-like n=1 Tax=Branchiostoma floridae TaxID=7739 RepID=C3ZPG0_BRAFL|nr:galactose-3-O-sulfotransferase 2-like [Branchiostoma floridae]|eukprot:XP_002589646.1 hypothetical protein BRAFLDRAFT_99253 [Branchiostoma floridae]